MTKPSRRASRNSGFTLIELMLVVTIISIIASISAPRIDLLLQKAHQATTKGNLGSIRSTLSLYYTDMEGRYPLPGLPDGYADNSGASLSEALTPKYIKTLPTPRLLERVGSFNGFNGLIYDNFAVQCMANTPPKDVYILAGPAGDTSGYDRPWVYDTDTGLIYICNNNFDWTGQEFYLW